MEGNDSLVLFFEKELAQFKATWARAIALAWSDPALMENLKKDPAQFLEQHFATAPNILSHLRVEVEESQEAFDYSNPDIKTLFGELERPKLTMYIPKAPKVEEQAIAITAYEARSRLHRDGCF